jgi:hypothetical protein
VWGGHQEGRGRSCSSAPAICARTPPGQQAGVLQEARVPIISNDVCNGPDFYGNQIKPKMFCAGYPEGGIDACQVRDCVGLDCHTGDGDQSSGWQGSWLPSWPPARFPLPTRATVAVPSCVRTASLGRHAGGCVAS